MNTKTIKVAEATNTQLDWLVAKCEGYDVGFDAYGVMISRHQVTDRFEPSTNAGWMWPIIDRERIATTPFTVSVGPDAGTKEWFANTERNSCYSDGSTSLIAAARCYVVSKLGETVEVPEELT